MSIREAISSSKSAGVALVFVLFASAGMMLAYTFWPTQPRIHGDEGFYTDDDGKTNFRDSLYRFPPFDHDGKTAYGAMVYTYSKGDFVAYQFRYTSPTKKRLEDAYAKAKADGDLSTVARLLAQPDVALGGCEIKMYGSNQWISRAVNPHPRVIAPDNGDCMELDP